MNCHRYSASALELVGGQRALVHDARGADVGAQVGARSDPGSRSGTRDDESSRSHRRAARAPLRTCARRCALRRDPNTGPARWPGAPTSRWPAPCRWCTPRRWGSAPCGPVAKSVFLRWRVDSVPATLAGALRHRSRPACAHHPCTGGRRASGRPTLASGRGDGAAGAVTVAGCEVDERRGSAPDRRRRHRRPARAVRPERGQYACSFGRSFIVSIVERSLICLGPAAAHEHLRERSTVGRCARTRELPPARRWCRCACSSTLKGLRRQSGQIEPPNVTRFASARQLFEPRLLCIVVRRDRRSTRRDHSASILRKRGAHAPRGT